MLSVLVGHWRYAHITALRSDPVPARPSHSYHSYMLAELRLVLAGARDARGRATPTAIPVFKLRLTKGVKRATRDLKRCRLMAGCVALVFNWWNLFVRLADPNHHREAITSRPLLLEVIGRQTSHAGRTTVTVTNSHGEHNRAR
ncbi:MAG: hypothetical protein JO283_02095 [Bradyrhizobium sp.]|nr:hypothetical protein [Bradyrhizobium sp.]